MEEDLAVQWETVEPPIVSLASPCYGNDSHVISSQAPDCEHETLDDFGCEFPDEDFDLEVDENEEQNTKTEDLNDDQAQDGVSEKDKEKCEGGGKYELESEFGGNGESRSRNAGTGRKGKSKKSGSGHGPCDQTPSWTSPSSMPHKSFLVSSGPSRHKQVKRRNHHLHNHSRVRRKNGMHAGHGVSGFSGRCRQPLVHFLHTYCRGAHHLFDPPLWGCC